MALDPTTWLIIGIVAGVITLVALLALLATRIVRVPSDKIGIVIGRQSSVQLGAVDPTGVTNTVVEGLKEVKE